MTQDTTTCTRRIQFCAGHRVKNHESKCANMHGHNYVAFFEAHADDLDSIGRVIDFSVLKEKIGGWIDNNWDHGFLYWDEDDQVNEAIIAFMGTDNVQKMYRLPYNPTAENMAKYLLHVVCPQVLEGSGVKVRKVTIHETENCYAEATLDE